MNGVGCNCKGLAPDLPGCLAMGAFGHEGAADHCRAEVTWAGLVYFSYSRETWHAFACDAHVHHLERARELTDRDREEIDRRRVYLDAAMQGRNEGSPPKPLRVEA